MNTNIKESYSYEAPEYKEFWHNVSHFVYVGLTNTTAGVTCSLVVGHCV